MRNLVGIIGLTLLASVVTPAVAIAAKGAPGRAVVRVETAPIDVARQGARTTGKRQNGQALIRWIQHARVLTAMAKPVR